MVGTMGEVIEEFVDCGDGTHFSCKYDTTQSTDSNRIRFYINGVNLTVNTTNWTNAGIASLYPG